MPLTALQVKNLQPDAEKDKWVSDQKGLRLLVKKSGGKYWRLKYRFNKKQKSLSLGVYPEVSLAEARLEANRARLLVADGTDPSNKRRLEKYSFYGDDQESLKAIAYEWWDIQGGAWTEDHKKRVWARLEDNALKMIGDMPIKAVKPMDIISVLRDIERRGALDVAERVKQDLSRVCRYAVQTGRLEFNPGSDLNGILKTRKRTHQPSLPRNELPQFLKHLEGYDKSGRLLTKLAINFLVLTFVRPGELRGARWAEFDLVKCEWRIPGERMKMRTEHIVPLSHQSIAILEQLKPISGRSEFVFPSDKDKLSCMSDNTMRKAIFMMGYDGKHAGKSKATPHGFRATASSILNEERFTPDAIERQLSHQERNGVRAAYIHHARYMDERVTMMQWWADYLDRLRSSDLIDL